MNNSCRKLKLNVTGTPQISKADAFLNILYFHLCCFHIIKTKANKPPLNTNLKTYLLFLSFYK